MCDNDIFIYCLPISGGKFVSQLGLLQEVYEARRIISNKKLNGRKTYCPDLILSSSGGNVAAYLAMGGNWTTEGIFRNIKQLEPHCFSRKWIPKRLSVIPNLPIALCKGSLYRKGYGASHIFRRLFTETTIQSTEIWTGTYNNDLKHAQFFCNKKQSESMVNDVFFNKEQCLYDSLNLKFMGGDIDLIADVSIASASIPLVVPNQKIGNKSFADGGCCFPSPLSVFENEICRIVRNDISIPQNSKFYYDKDTIKEEDLKPWQEEKTYTVNEDGTYSLMSTGMKNIERNMRMFYFFPYHEDRINLHKESELEKETNVLQQILHCALLQDRNKAIDLMNRLSSSVIYSTFPEMTTIRLSNLLKTLSKHKHYLICLSPHGIPCISLTKFTDEDILREMLKARSGYSCQVWCSVELLDED